MISSSSCTQVMTSSTNSSGSPHTQDPILNSNSFYATCTNVDSNNDNARLTPLNSFSTDTTYGFGVKMDVAPTSPDLEISANAGTMYCSNTNNRYYGIDNFCNSAGTLSLDKKLGDYSWEFYVR